MRARTFWRRKDGSVAVEFAILLPVLLLFMFGVIQFGFIMYVQNDMMNAAREAARRLAVDDTTTEAEAQTIADNYLTNWPLTFTIAAEDTTTTGDDFVRVSITTPMSDAAVVTDIIGAFVGKTISAEVVMREEG